jgi:serine/threonine protein kinase
MEKADKSLLNIINQRKKLGKPFSSSELFEFWRKIINTFAFCTKFKITHNDIKPSNILLKKKKKSNEN